jgi:hypothetical protein
MFHSQDPSCRTRPVVNKHQFAYACCIDSREPREVQQNLFPAAAQKAIHRPVQRRRRGRLQGSSHVHNGELGTFCKEDCHTTTVAL